MNIKSIPSTIKQASGNLLDVLTAQRGTFSGLSMMAGQKMGMPKTTPEANIKRYIGWVYDAINKNSAERASVPLRLYATRGTGQSKAGMRGGIGKSIGRTITKQERMTLAKSTIGQSARFRAAEDIEEISAHPFLDLYNDAWFDLMLTSIFEELTGNSYTAFEFDGMGVPIEPIVLPSQIVKPLIRKGEGIVAYKVGNGIAEITLPADQVVHNRFPNPSSPYVGMAPLTAAALAADRDTDMDLYEGALNKNHARPDFMVALKGEGVQRKDLDAYRKEWKAQRGGIGNNGQPLFAAGDVDIKQFGFSPREMAFLQGRKITMEQIFGTFGVPVALGKTEGVNRANLEAAIYQWTRFTIVPRLRMHEAALNSQLIPHYNEPRLFVAYDNPVPEDREAMMKERETNLKNYVVTVNEERATEGLPSVPWGDVPIVQSTGLPLGSPTPTPAAQPTHRTVTVSSGGIKSMQKGDPDDAPDISGGANKPPTPDEKKVIKIADDMQAKQGKDVISEFDRVAPSGSYDAMKFSPKSYADEYLAPMTQAMTPAWERGLIVGNLDLPGGAGIDVGAYIEQPQAIKTIEQTTFKFLESEGESVQREFTEKLSAGIKNGDSTQELRKRITGMFTDERRNERGLMIARTESARAIELGREASWKESGVVSAKVWDANGDSCPFCQAMDGKIVEIGQNYFAKGDVFAVEFEGQERRMTLGYSDTPAPPLHPFCRCSLQPQLIDA